MEIPKLRKGSYFLSLLEPRRTAEKAFVAVIQEACVHGISTRSVDDLVKAMGSGEMSRSQDYSPTHLSKTGNAELETLTFLISTSAPPETLWQTPCLKRR
jgi:transposase-like protein